jgi:hypothetical protein
VAVQTITTSLAILVSMIRLVITPSEGETHTSLYTLFLSLFTHIYAYVDVCPQILSFRNSYANYYYCLECEKVDNYVGCSGWSYEGFFFL